MRLTDALPTSLHRARSERLVLRARPANADVVRLSNWLDGQCFGRGGRLHAKRCETLTHLQLGENAIHVRIDASDHGPRAHVTAMMY